jgi:hypothetical protein
MSGLHVRSAIVKRQDYARNPTYTFIPIVDVHGSCFPFPSCMGWHYVVNRPVTIQTLDLIFSQATKISRYTKRYEV